MPETISRQLAYYRRMNPGGATTFKTITVGGKNYQLPSTVKKESTWRKFIKFFQKFNKNPTSANYLALMNKEGEGVKNLVRQYRSFLLGDKKHYGQPFEGTPTANTFKGLKLKIKPEATKLWKSLDQTVVNLAKQPGMSRARGDIMLGESAERIRKLNTIFKENPNISLRGIAAKLNGRAYAMGNNAARLAMATEASNGVALYLTALQKGREMKNWVPPTGKNKDKIIKNILEGTEGGFRFQEGTLRRYKFNIRDALLKNPQFTSETLRNKLAKIGVIDEAVGLSATYKAAPGYTELVQFIPDEANRQKGIQLDREFTKLVEKSKTGDFTGVKDFNKRSTAFGKKWNIDTPKIKIGGVPSETITYFDKMSDAAKKNVLEIAKGPGKGVSGFAIESGALPWGEMGTRVEALKKNKPAFEKFLEAVEKSPAACRKILNYQTGGISATCGAAITKDPVGAAEKISKLKVTGGALGKVKNAATTFLGILGRGGVKAAPLAAVAALGAVAEPLVKQFRNDDYSTYLSDPEQQGSMLLSMVEAETPKVDEEILKWQYPGMAGAAAAAIPGSSAMYKARRLPFKSVKRGIDRAAMGVPRAALGPVGKFLAGSFSPLGVAASLPISVAAQVKGGSEIEDIATDPFNWMGPAFASAGARMATRGMPQTGILAKAIRMGMSPTTLRLGSRFLGMPGLALSAGLTGYDWWKNRGKDKDDEFKIRTYKDDDD